MPHPFDDESRPDVILRALRRGDYSVLHRAELATLERYLIRNDPWGINEDYLALRRHIERARLSGELQED